MSWMIPSMTAAIIGTFLLALAFVYLYTAYRERYIGIWAFSWFISLLRYAAEFFMLFNQESDALLIISQSLSLLSGIFLSWGSYVFIGRSMPKWLCYAAILGIIWMSAGVKMEFDFLWTTLPTYLILGTIYFWTGQIFIRFEDFRGTGKYFTGSAFILWGIHKADYPFLRPVAWFAPWGYLFSALLTLSVAIGTLLVYFQKTLDDLNENKNALHSTNEELEITIEELNAAEEELRQQFEELSLQRSYFQQLFENSPDAIAIADNSGIIINANRGFEELFEYSAKEAIGRYLNEIIVPGDLQNKCSSIFLDVHHGKIVQKESVRKRKDGSPVNVSILAYPIEFSDEKSGTVAIYSDITARKQAEQRLKYLSLHDPLTRLYNRTYFEEELRRLEAWRNHPIGIIICDVDGLKLVNDTLGHDAGDKLLIAAANVIKSSFREGDMTARIGGDEFAVLLPNSPEPAVTSACRRIREGVEEYNTSNPECPLSISVGFAISGGSCTNIGNLFKEADDSMYREKLLRSQSARSSIVQTLMKALEARDYITEGHADRLQELVLKMAARLGISGHKIADLRLFAQFHDIGKVGIPDRILFKPDRLTAEEFAEMKRHCEIGHRIAQSAPDLSHIADLILKHHEWWNGNGYPLGLKGEDIPLECRILAIADAYDAMTNDRPYRIAMSHGEALEELKKFSGIQFDPWLVSLFITFTPD